MAFEYPQVIDDNGRSTLGPNMVPVTVAQAVRSIANHPAATHSPVFRSHALRAFNRGAESVGEKAFVVNPVGGRTIYDWCDAVELGYVLQPYMLCGQQILEWFDPAMIMDRRQLSIPIRDIRAWAFGTFATGTLQTILCGTAPSCTDTNPATGGLDLDYCFDFNAVKYVCVGAAEINAFIKECRRNVPLNIFGQAIDTTTANGMLAFENMILTQKFREGLLKDFLAEVAAFFTGFVAQHPEIATRTDLQPKTIALPAYPAGTPTADEINTWFDSVLAAIYNRRREVRELLRRCGIGGNPTGEILLMNWKDAMCFQWMQACKLTQCYLPGQVSFTISPGQFTASQEAAMTEFYNRFRIGQYGAGRIYFKDGSYIDIWASEDCIDGGGLLPQGTAYLLYKGWDGPQANNNALRPVVLQWGEMIDYYRARSPVAAQTLQPLANNTGLKVLPANGCGDVFMAWNHYLISNAPFMQTKFTGLRLCDEENWTVTCFPALPAISQASVCTSNVTLMAQQQEAPTPVEQQPYSKPTGRGAAGGAAGGAAAGAAA